MRNFTGTGGEGAGVTTLKMHRGAAPWQEKHGQNYLILHLETYFLATIDSILELRMI